MASSVVTGENGNSRSNHKILFCSFCQNTPAAVLVKVRGGLNEKNRNLVKKKNNEESKPFCLLHYYTTSAVRAKASNVSVINETTVQSQLDGDNRETSGSDIGVQELFAEAFTELQQELSQEAARAYSSQKADPLSLLHDIRGKPKRLRGTSSAAKRKQSRKSHDDDSAGGFIREVPLPERVKQNEERLQRMKEQQVLQMQEKSNHRQQQQPSLSSADGNPYKRRKPARKSIWNLAIEKNASSSNQLAPTKNTANYSTEPSEKMSSLTATNMSQSDVTCSCGSSDVVTTGNVTGVIDGVRKGEIWGNKDQIHVTRYQCSKCGKVWNEEE